MLVTTIWVLFVAESFAKDLAPHTYQQILNENVESRARMAYYDSTHKSNPHYKINFIYELRKTNEVTEIEKIEEEIGKYMHHHHQPPKTTTTTEAQPNIEVLNEKDFKETTTHNPSETPITVKEKHHHKHEEKEVTSTLAPMPPAPKLREPFISGHPHFPAALPAKIKNELKELLAHELRHITHRHPDHQLHISRTTSEAPVKIDARTEVSPLVTQSEAIPNSDVPESHLDHTDPSETSEAPVKEEGQTELSPVVTQSEEMREIPNYDVTGSHLDPDFANYKPRPIPHRNLYHRLHISRRTSEAPIEVESRTELSSPVIQSDAIPNNDVAESHSNHPDSPAHELRPIPQRHPDHRLHISRSTSEAPVEEEAQTELSPHVSQSDNMEEKPNNDVQGSPLDHPDSPAHEVRPTPHRLPEHRLHISRTTSEAPVEEEARTELSPPATLWEDLKKIPKNDVAKSHLDYQDSPAHELRTIPHRHLDHRLYISRITSEVPVEVEARTNHASTEKVVHLRVSPTSHDLLFLSHKDQNTLAKIRPKSEDVQHGSIALPSRPRPVYRGSYKFSWDDINDMHESAVPKVSQLKENPNPPPVPTLSPWYDGYGK